MFFSLKTKKSNRRSTVKNVLRYSFWTVIAFLASAGMALAAEAAPAAAGGVDYTKAIVLGCSLIGAGIAIGVGASGAGAGMWRIIT